MNTFSNLSLEELEQIIENNEKVMAEHEAKQEQQLKELQANLSKIGNDLTVIANAILKVISFFTGLIRGKK
jgi:hypothetical protein